MGEELVISLKNVSKCYKRYSRPVERLKEILLPGTSRAEEFWALRDINFDVCRGETLGIVGQNGSGKSTLLQIIAGTLTATTGEVHINGRVSALLELGCGFNPEFTGRQNVFFNGQILGLSVEEIEAKFDDIAAFAEIGDFINQPVKTYSSGMIVRLAFAVVANTEPQILIIDEALAVGDAKFQARCMKRIRQLKEQGVTILFVSHDSGSVKMLCQRAALINRGRMLEIGEPKEVVNHYIALLGLGNNAEIDDISQISSTESYVINDETLALEETIASTSPTENLDSNGVTVSSESLLKVEQIATVVPNKNVGDSQNNEEINIQEISSFFEASQANFVHRHGNQMAIIHNCIFTSLAENVISMVETGDVFKIKIFLEVKADLSDLVVGISIRNLLGVVVYGTNTRLMDMHFYNLNPGHRMTVTFQMNCKLNKGVYTVTVGVHSENGVHYDWIDELIVFEVINSNICDGMIDLQSCIKVNQVYLATV